MIKKFKLLSFGLFITIIFSCTSENADENSQIIEYINNNKLVVTDTISDVLVCIRNPGGIDKPKIDSTKSVTILVTGKYMDGAIFENNASDQPATINMGVLLDGLRIGITQFGRGGSGTIIIPSNLGFGSNPPRGVRPNASLAFDIELLNFK